MWSFISGVSIVCFAASYGVALCLEISRLFFRIRFRNYVLQGFMLAGLLAHSLYLVREAQQSLAEGGTLSSWYHGCLLLGWVLAGTYVAFLLWSKPASMGLFLLPTTLVLAVVAQLFPHASAESSPVTDEMVVRLWGSLHGVSLLLGTVVVVVGFLAGLMYFYQSNRLKHKKLASRTLRLPSLERLQRINEGALVTSCGLLMLGFVSGIWLNWHQDARLRWDDPVVWPSAVMLLWVIAALTFNLIYKPARQGHKVAYLTFASSVFLAIVIAIIMFVPESHGRPAASPPDSADAAFLSVPNSSVSSATSLKLRGGRDAA